MILCRRDYSYVDAEYKDLFLNAIPSTDFKVTMAEGGSKPHSLGKTTLSEALVKCEEKDPERI